jgi:hypothetical protein
MRVVSDDVAVFVVEQHDLDCHWERSDRFFARGLHGRRRRAVYNRTAGRQRRGKDYWPSGVCRSNLHCCKFCSRQSLALIGTSDMASEVVLYQQWSVYNSTRRQWLLARVVAIRDGQATLKYDPLYGIAAPDNLCVVDVSDLLTRPMQYRAAEP